MRIGILTFHQADNYGAVAQAYALMQVLCSYGHDAVIIDYTSEYLKNPFGLKNFRNKGLVAQCLTLAGECTRLPRKRKLRAFRKKYLQMTSYKKKEELDDLNEQFDLFIAGSDQVWNTKISGGDSTYFLDFVKDKNKKGSYAASIGFSSLTKEEKSWYYKLLNDFEYLNVREEAGAKLIKEITGRDAAVTLDPTLLLDAQHWKKLAKKPEVDEDYILTYQVGMDRDLLDYAEYLGKTYGCPVYSIPLPQGGFIKAKPLINLGLEEWLGYFQHAKYVVTDSFHGLVFSLIMEREFCVCYSERERSLTSRQLNLMNLLGIEGRNIKSIGKQIPHLIDYDGVSKRLLEQRKKSLGILLEMGKEKI